MTLSSESFAFLSPTPGKSDRARVKLLAAALELFAEKGPRGATVRQIARKAGQNVASIAYYFGSKDKLYHAVLEGLVQELQLRAGGVFQEIRALRAQPEPSPVEAIRLFQKFLRTIYLQLISRNEAVYLGRLIVPEQLAPTAGFEILYNHAFKDLHEALSFLVGLALGRDPRDQEIILRTHTLMGQVYFFAMTREAILRRLNWRDLQSHNPERVADLLAEHAEILLTGLAAKMNKPPTTP